MAKLTGGRLAAARRFRTARGQKGMTQTAVADAAGITRAALNRFETGKTWPTATVQAAIEPIVGMATGELEEIAARYSDEADLIDEETRLTERLAEIHRVIRHGPHYDSRDKAARIKELEERIALDQAELDALRGE